MEALSGVSVSSFGLIALEAAMSKQVDRRQVTSESINLIWRPIHACPARRC